MQLSIEQLAFVSIVASALVAVLRLIYEVAKKESFQVPDWVMLALVYVASFGLAVLWFPQTLPHLPVFSTDFVGSVALGLTYAGQLLTMLTAYAAAAAIIYDALLFKVKEAVGTALAPTVYVDKKAK